MGYSGILYDADNSQPIPYATVTLYNGSTALARTATSASGSFNLESNTPGEKLQFSSAGYKTATFFTNNFQRSYYLEKDYKELDPVTLNNKKKSAIPWLILAAVILLSRK